MNDPIAPFPGTLIKIGVPRESVRQTYGSAYSEFLRTPMSTSPTGKVGGDVFLVYDEEDRVELIEIFDPLFVTNPAVLVPFPLEYHILKEYLTTEPHRVSVEDAIVFDHMGAVLTVDDDERKVTILSIARPWYFDYL